MTKINNIDEFNTITSSITSFSHAYLFNVNSLEKSLPYIKEFAKKIICPHSYEKACQKNCDICYQIDNDEYDDLYIVNPDTISINTKEIELLQEYMKTTSIHENGKRVYIIYGFERLKRDVSNKILKFLEEPEKNIYALLITENIDQILSTIISRCQIINLTFEKNELQEEQISNMKKFIIKIIKSGQETIAYTNEIFKDNILNRLEIYNNFEILERIVSENINKRYQVKYLEICDIKELDDISIEKLINMLDITNKLKTLIKQNINLNLLIDRYIIEISKELKLCKK